jgi:hypothetical protein
MGTNFYHHVNHCECCGRFDILHICKSMTLFQGYQPDPGIPNDPTPTLLSWQDWKTALRAGGEIWDEYGNPHEVERFIGDVESTDPALRRRHFDWMVRYSRTYNIENEDWHDADGFSFTAGEFT